MVQRVSLTITTNNIEDLMNDMKSAMVYMSNTISMMNGLVDEIEAAWRSGKVVEVNPADIAKMQAEMQSGIDKVEEARREALQKAYATNPEASIGLMPDPEGKAVLLPPGTTVMPTDPRLRGTQPSKKKNR